MNIKKINNSLLMIYCVTLTCRSYAKYDIKYDVKYF